MNVVNKSITLKLTLLLLLANIIIFGISGWWILSSTNSRLTDAVQENLEKETELALTKISETFAIAKQVANQGAFDNNIRTYLGDVDKYHQVTGHYLYNTVLQTLKDYNNTYDKLIFVWVANDRANFFIDNTEYVSSPEYDATIRPWYEVAMDADGVTFTTPYEEYGSGIMVVSAITALRDSQGDVFGFLSADVSLEDIPAIMEAYKVGEEGTNFLFGKDGTIVYAEENSMLEVQISNIFDVPELKTYAEAALQGENRIEEVRYKGKDYFVNFKSLDINGWGAIQLVSKAEVLSQQKRFNLGVIVSYFLSAGIFLACITVSIKKLTKPIVYSADYAKKLGSGDLTNNIDLNYKSRLDEIGQLTNAFDDLSVNLSILVGEIKTSADSVKQFSVELIGTADDVAMNSENMAMTLEDIAKGASEQATSTENGASKTFEMGRLIEANRSQMDHLNEASSNIVTMIQEGLVIVEDLSDKMEETDRAAKSIFNVIRKTDENTSKISEASSVIASIAEQTNLLALNAAIEAARAGEFGKGFAVVAEEIRKLAEQSTASTKDIDKIVHELIESSREAVKSINQVNDIVNDQVAAVLQTENKFKDISKAVDQSVEAIEKLNVSEKNMEAQKTEIMDTLQNLSSIADEYAASTEEASAGVAQQSDSMKRIVESAKDLSVLSEELADSVSQFRLKKNKK